MLTNFFISIHKPALPIRMKIKKILPFPGLPGACFTCFIVPNLSDAGGL
jgi:hypothetical protein